MEPEASKILADIKGLLEKSKDQGELLKEELEILLPKLEEDIPKLEEVIQETTETLSGMKLSQIAKLRRYTKGENFSRFCERFQEYVYITKMKDKHLYMYFLLNVDDETYSTLKSVNLSTFQKQESSLFCGIYKTAIYGDESIALKNEVMDCKQQSDEDISDFAYRLREKANIAYADPDIIDENYLLAFIRGVKSSCIKIKLNENSLTYFNDAVKLAKKLEKIEGMLNEKPDISSILKETSANFQTSRRQGRSPSFSENRKLRESGDSWRSSSTTDRSRSHDRIRLPSNDRQNRRYQNNKYSNTGMGKRPRNQYQSKICWYCNRIGHILSQCWQRRNNGRGRPWQRNYFGSQTAPRSGVPWSQNGQENSNTYVDSVNNDNNNNNDNRGAGIGTQWYRSDRPNRFSGLNPNADLN